MVEDSPFKQDLPSSKDNLPEPPAPLGRALLFITVALLSSMALCWCLRQNATPPDTGTINGRPRPLLSDWTGRIERFWVQPGDAVHAGDPLAILLDEHLLGQIERQQREVDEIQLALNRAERSVDEELTRRLNAIDAEIVSLKAEANVWAVSEPASEPVRSTPAVLRLRELETLRMNAAHQARERQGLHRIREELLRAEAKLQHLQSLPKHVTLPAPVTGSIGRVLRMPGERVVPGTPLLELADQDQPYLVVEMPEPLAKRFALGDAIPLNFPGREPTVGRVTNMQPTGTGHANAPRSQEPKKSPRVRLEIEPLEEDWPEIPLKSPVKIRTSDAKAMSRRVVN